MGVSEVSEPLMPTNVLCTKQGHIFWSNTSSFLKYKFMTPVFQLLRTNLLAEQDPIHTKPSKELTTYKIKLTMK